VVRRTVSNLIEEANMSLSVVATLPAPRQRGRDVQQVIQGLRREHPRAKEVRLAELLADELVDDRELLLIVAGDLVHKAVAPAKVKAKPTLKAAEAARRERASRQAVEKEQTTKIAANLRQRITLDAVITLLNGGTKELRYCTAGELTELAVRGSIYGRIAAKVMEAAGADAMVGEIICARDLEEICVQSEKTPA
jgi:hypothetical protein